MSSEPTTKATIPRCAKCKGTDVLFDAYAAWNAELQQHEIHSTYDRAVCEDCGGECKVEWSDLE